MSTLEMKNWDQRDFSGVMDLEDEFEQIPISLDANGKDMNYGSKHRQNSDRDERVQLAKAVKDQRITFPKALEARAGRQRGSVEVTE